MLGRFKALKEGQKHWTKDSGNMSLVRWAMVSPSKVLWAFVRTVLF